MKRLGLGGFAALALIVTCTGVAGAQQRQGTAPELRPPVSAGGTGRTTPTIVLPPGWANPGTGGSGGAVPEPVVVAPSTGTAGGYAVSPSTGSASGVSPSTGTARGRNNQ